jgi:hypothetical protein
MRIIQTNVALTRDYPNNDPQKFRLDTPTECSKAIFRAWSVIPSKRLLQDVMDWPRVNQLIWEAKGVMIAGEVMRKGKRVIKSDGSITKTTNSKSSDVKATINSNPIHPDAQRGLKAILDFGDVKFEEFVNLYDNAIDAEMLIEDENQQTLIRELDDYTQYNDGTADRSRKPTGPDRAFAGAERWPAGRPLRAARPLRPDKSAPF